MPYQPIVERRTNDAWNGVSVSKYYAGRFILSGDCDLPPQTPDENILAAVRAARDAEKVLFGE